MRFQALCILLLTLLIPCAFSICTQDVPRDITTSLTLCPGQLQGVHYVRSASNLTISCDGAEISGTGGALLLIESTGTVIITNCVFMGSNPAIYVNHSAQTYIRNSSFHHNGKGIYAHTGGGNVIVDGVHLSNNSEEGLGFASLGQGLVSNNLFADNRYGIYLYNRSSGVIVHKNRFYNNGDGVLMEGQRHMVSDNIFGRNDNGVRMLAVRDVRFFANKMSLSKENGLSILNSVGVLVKDNSIEEGSGSGLVLFHTGSSEVSGNTLSGNENAGLFITAGSDRNTIHENTLSENKVYGIYLTQSKDNTIASNIIESSSLIIGAQALGNEFCPGNIYGRGAKGPSCETEKPVILPKSEPVQTQIPAVEEKEELPKAAPSVQEPVKNLSAPTIPQTEQESIIEEVANNHSVSPLAQALLREVAPSPLQGELPPDDIEGTLREIMLADLVMDRDLDLKIKSTARRMRSTLDKLTMRKSIKMAQDGDDVYSRIDTRFRFKATMYNLAIYEKIPKSCAQSMDEIIIDEELLNRPGVSFEVINADPLIVWKFDEVQEGEELVVGYTIKNKVVELPKTLVLEDSDGSLIVNEALMCREDDTPRTIPLAERIKDSLWYYVIPTVIAVLIPFFIFAFNRFGRKGPPMLQYR